MRFLVFTAVLLASSGLSAQQEPASWPVPQGAQVTVDRQTGVISIRMPREVADRVAWGGSTRFESWRKTPHPGSGPFRATRVEDASLPTHTLYYPEGLPAAAGKLPVVLWANGGCRNTSVEFTTFLGELASRGYFIVAVGRNDVAFATTFPDSARASMNGQPPLQVTGGKVMLTGLDWITRENARRGSAYFDKVDLTKVAALGQSCGGRQVWDAARDSRIKTLVALNSAFQTQSADGTIATTAADGWTIEKLAVPAAYFIGGPGDQAYGRAQASFASAPASATMIKANLPVAGHTGAYREPHPEWVSAVAGWLDWQLKGDAKAKAMFAGANCGLCRNPNWWYEAKNVR